jgi:hypothetical protein
MQNLNKKVNSTTLAKQTSSAEPTQGGPAMNPTPLSQTVRDVLFSEGGFAVAFVLPGVVYFFLVSSMSWL